MPQISDRGQTFPDSVIRRMTRTGTHKYTITKAENDYLVSLGWHAEGISWYGMTAD
ncbi:MAG: hypothetical protein VZR02_06345 [Lachnospiraceae bacterium]|nr:hypothetical protein [Lachnospiraceae bacterium]